MNLCLNPAAFVRNLFSVLGSHFMLHIKVKQLHDWLAHWHDEFLHNGRKEKKQTDSGSKKAVLLSGTPGIGKSTSAKLISQMLGFQAIEVLFHQYMVFLQIYNWF